MMVNLCNELCFAWSERAFARERQRRGYLGPASARDECERAAPRITHLRSRVFGTLSGKGGVGAQPLAQGGSGRSPVSLGAGGWGGGSPPSGEIRRSLLSKLSPGILCGRLRLTVLTVFTVSEAG